ncbi:phage tail tape measure protein [Photobacterium sp. 53610]|uniref:phage tail tape measure protein n=1 Tax=Photobacterium sp. 53610 TaxID=3102789 RepID=UPI002ED7D96D
MSLPEPLRFTVGLIDQISKPLGNIQRQFSGMASSYRDGTHTMVAGAAGVAGAGIALQQALMPAIEMDRVLGEVKSLGVADEQLQQLSDTALNFAVEYGKSATEFVAASYDIKSAMGDLTGDELSNLSRTAAITAAATKADTKTITDYFGTMYGIFQDQATVIGKDAWADQLGSYTALAVERFKTDGVKLSQSFRALGNDATVAGAGLGEQFAILGLLGNQMDGGVAATKYQAFISKAAGAGKSLGLNFLDANNQLLDAASIIDVIKGKYGDSLDALEKMKLEKAFGGKEAMSFISTLYGQTKELRKQIADFSQVKGLDQAMQMAGAMTDQWERLEQGLFAVRAAFGQALLPSILPVVEMLADGAREVLLWTKLFPNLTKYIGYAVIGFLSLTAVGGAFTVMVGAAKMAFSTLMLLMSPITGTVALVAAAFAAAAFVIYEYWDPIAAFFSGAWEALSGTFSNVFGVSNETSGALSEVFKAVSLLWGAVTNLWDSTFGLFAEFLSASDGLNAFTEVGRLFGMTMANSFMLVIQVLKLVAATFTSVITGITALWNFAFSGFSDTSVFAPFIEATEAFGQAFWGVVGTLWKQVTDMINWVIKQVNLIPGIEIGLMGEQPDIKIDAVAKAQPRAQVQPGGVAKTLANYQSSSTHYGGVSIYAQQMNNPQDFANEMEMYAG